MRVQRNHRYRSLSSFAQKNLSLDYYLPKGKIKTDRLNVRSVKVYADGALGSRGAWLLEPYTDRPDHFGHETLPMEFVKETDNDNFIMELYSECDDNEEDCNEETVELNIKECVWYAELNNDFFENLEFDFTEGFNLYVYQENNVIAEGNWSVSEGENTLELYVEIDFEGLTGTWQIVECDDDRFELVRGDDILILEQDCEEDSNPFECFSSFEAEIVVCDDNNDSIETFDLTTAYANCNPEADVITYHETISDADNAVNSIASPEAYTNITNPQTIYVRVEIGEDFEVFPIDIYVEDCSDESCSEADVNAYLVECIWNVVSLNGSDDLIIYTHPDEFKNFLFSQDFNNKALLLMSSGNYGGLDFNALKNLIT